MVDNQRVIVPRSLIFVNKPAGAPVLYTEVPAAAMRTCTYPVQPHRPDRLCG